MRRAGGNFLGLIILIAVILLLYYWAPWNNHLPDLSKPVFLSGTHTNPPNTYSIKGVLNNDNTGSITNETSGNFTEQGTWQIISQNDEMIKIDFKTSNNYMITLYKKNKASIAGGGFQINGNWRQ